MTTYPFTTITALRGSYPRWMIQRSVCESGCCKVYEAILTEGTASRVIVRHTLGELAIRLDHVTKEKQ
jgi:hypothetical protein